MKKIFASDNAFKVYSVFIAILLWVFVVYNQNPQSTKNIDGIGITYTNIAELESAGLTIRKDGRGPAISVSVKGRRLSISKIDASNVSASVTIPNIREGEYEVAVETKLPLTDVSIVDKKPYTIKVVVEKIKRISMPVEVKYTGNPKNEQTHIEAEAMPQQISMWGPQSVIDTIASVTATFDVSTAVEGNSANTKCKIISKDGKDITNDTNINLDAETIALVPTVYKTKDVPIEVRYVGEMPHDYAISAVEITPAVLRIGSKDNLIDTIEKIITEPINISELNKNEKFSVNLIIPDNVANVFSVTGVQVSISVAGRVSKTIDIENISFLNGDSTKKYEAKNLPVSVTISGAKNLLDSVSSGAYVDVSGLHNGTYTLPLVFDLPYDVSLLGYYSVNVTVSDKESSAQQ